jgi:hypothetical protein
MEPERSPELRASDVDRERVLARLRDAHAEGRLDQNDFYERLDAVYEARTYGELDAVTRDLPPVPLRPAASSPRPAARPVPAAPQETVGKSARALRALWLMWLTVVLINVVIWASVSVGTGDLHYFWPLWVAGPWGGVLLALPVVSQVARPSDDRR